MVNDVNEHGATQLATKTFDEEIRERLRQLVKTRSQSDLARKTNTLVSTVNRYLKATKIPGEFCAAVINGLGVNPAWLMTGEGTPFLADVSAKANAGRNLFREAADLGYLVQTQSGDLYLIQNTDFDAYNGPLLPP